MDQLKKQLKQGRQNLFANLLSLKTIPATQLYQTAANVWGLSFIDLTTDTHKLDNSHGIPDDVLTKLTAVSLIDSNNQSILALGEPEKIADVHRLSFYTKTNFSYALADIQQIKKIQNQQRDSTPLENTLTQSELLQYLTQADDLAASDLHIEPFQGYCRLRIRVDGILHPLHSISSEQGRKLTSQIKLLAQMDIAQRRMPQDGRLRFPLKQKILSLRVNSLPTIHGEKLVLRLLEQHGRRFKLDKIGLFAGQYKKIRKTLKQPHGLFLVTGPTGSGKTVTLYALIELLNTGKENICTIEDPVEITEDGINQISVNRKSGLDFSTALRSLLRQDPDILMVGEIRDSETAEIAIKAAQTGHLVMATLHTRTAKQARTRLLQLGVKDYALDDALKLVIAQRLPRQLCPDCKQQIPTPLWQQDFFARANMPACLTVHHQTGCNFCMRGYAGRSGIFELYDPQHSAERQLGTPDPQHYTLEQAGLQQVALGNITAEELTRVL